MPQQRSASASRRSSSQPRRESAGRGRGGGGSRGTDWSHPQGIPLWKVQVGQYYDGYVTNSGYTVFVDFGAVKDGILKVASKYRRSFTRDMEVKHMRVVDCDTAAERVTLAPDPDFMPDMRPARARSDRDRSQSKRRDGSLARGRSSEPRERALTRNFSHPEGMPLEEVAEGSLVADGHVTCAGMYGVFVDIGAVKDGRMKLHRSLWSRFKVGDMIPCCQVDRVDVQRQQIGLVVDDPQELIDKLHSERRSIEEFQAGHIVSGWVNAVNKYGIFVNVGAVRDAMLSFRSTRSFRFNIGDFIERLKVRSVDGRNQHIAVEVLRADEVDDELEDEEEEEGEEEEELQRPPPLVKKAAMKQPKMKLQPKATTKTRSRPDSSPPTRSRPREASPAAKPKLRPKAGPVAAKAATRTGRSATRRTAVAEFDEEEDDGALGGIRLERLQAGDDVDGILRGFTETGNGIYVEIKGMDAMGILRPTDRMRKEARDGDLVEGMVVESVDVRRREVQLSMESPELSVDSDLEEQASMVKNKTKARSKPTEPENRVRARAGGRSG